MQRAGQHLAHAVLYKPRNTEGMRVEQVFLPLIVMEAANANAPEPPTIESVYFNVRVTEIAGQNFDQIEYVWMLNGKAAMAQGPCSSYRGVRITVDHDGFPLIWEALSSERGPRLLFVAESLEQEAKALFGGPRSAEAKSGDGGTGQEKAGFALEAESSGKGQVIIVAALEQGPVPMGPYVYLSAEPRWSITSILCRCSPSQVDEFVATHSYTLQPIETLESQCPDVVKKLHSTPPLEKVLRWPRQR